MWVSLAVPLRLLPAPADGVGIEVHEFAGGRECCTGRCSVAQPGIVAKLISTVECLERSRTVSLAGFSDSAAPD